MLQSSRAATGWQSMAPSPPPRVGYPLPLNALLSWQKSTADSREFLSWSLDICKW
jgi:hypothetical protein